LPQNRKPNPELGFLLCGIDLAYFQKWPPSKSGRTRE
ncbi:MAG: hypothetical protein FD134_1732, partial [Gallionellaceae bacterium]